MNEPAILEWLCKKYVQRADDRQKALGLQYTEAETHDLAREIHNRCVAPLETKLERAWSLLRDIEARLQSGDTDFPSLGYDIECRMHEVLHDKP